MKMVDVVGAVIVRDGKVFAARRGDPTKTLYGKWEFPGGKIEIGEDGPAALIREMQEECLCKIKVGNIVTTSINKYDFGTVRLSTYYCTLEANEPQLTEHSEFIWQPIEKLNELDWALADTESVDLIMEQYDVSN
jgi:8-oxo-dGTP diphosphatase